MITILAISACGIYTLAMLLFKNGYWLTSIIKLVLFLGVALLYFWKNRAILLDLLRLPEQKVWKLPGILGLGCILLILGGYYILRHFFDSNQILAGLHNQGITRWTYPFVFIHIVAVNSFLEEFFFRGFLFLNLYRRKKIKYAYVFSSVLFALYHIGMFQSWFSGGMFLFCLIGLVAAGLVFCEIDRRYQSIYAGWLIHLGANIGINLIGAYFFYFG